MKRAHIYLISLLVFGLSLGNIQHRCVMALSLSAQKFIGINENVKTYSFSSSYVKNKYETNDRLLGYIKVKDLNNETVSQLLHIPGDKPNNLSQQIKWTMCKCKDLKCNCCVHLEVEQAHLNDTVCIIYEYLPKQVGIQVVIKLNERTLYNHTVSASNPPPICESLKDTVQLCILFYNIDISNRTLNGCLDVLVRFGHKSIARFKLGCFHLREGTQYLEQKRINFVFLDDGIFTYASSEDQVSNAWDSSNNSSALDDDRKTAWNETDIEMVNEGESMITNFQMAFAPIYNALQRLHQSGIAKLSFNFQPDKIFINLYNKYFKRVNSSR